MEKDGAVDVVKVGEINPKHFENVFQILTNDVVITEKQIAHIMARHPQDYMHYAGYIPQILSDPDYIIEANRAYSAVLMKSFTGDGERFQLVLRLRAANDPDTYRNSIITFLRIREKEWNRLISNKRILYKSV